MALVALSVSNVRCITRAELSLTSGLTLIVGDNGSGKTSLLESIFLLGRGRSFRIRDNKRLIQHDKDHFRVTGQISRLMGLCETIGLEATTDGTRASIGGRLTRSLAELAQAFPVDVIEPGIHRLLEEGGYRRRRWLDWAVFHVEPGFADTWSRYHRGLKQRNAALRSRSPDRHAWDTELSRLGEAIAEARRRLLDDLRVVWEETVTSLSGLAAELVYVRGWSAGQSLEEALLKSRSRDELLGITHAGPHRADVSVRLDGRPAREVLSRGQQKLVAVAMSLAQLKLLHAAGVTTTLLLDDPSAELDHERLDRFITQVTSLQCPLVVTSLRSDTALFGHPEHTFRVDQGRVEPV